MIFTMTSAAFRVLLGPDSGLVRRRSIELERLPPSQWVVHGIGLHNQELVDVIAHHSRKGTTDYAQEELEPSTAHT